MGTKTITICDKCSAEGVRLQSVQLWCGNGRDATNKLYNDYKQPELCPNCFFFLLEMIMKRLPEKDQAELAELYPNSKVI